MQNYKVFLTTSTGVKTLLKYEPEGLGEYGSKLLRHNIFNSVFVEIVLDLRFVKDGFEMLKTEFLLNGIKGITEIEVQELNRATKAYEIIFEGVANFTEYIEEELYISVSFETSTKVEKLRSREANKYNIEKLISSDNVTLQPIQGLKKKVNLTEFHFILWAFMTSKYNYYEDVPLGGDPPQTRNKSLQSIKAITLHENFLKDNINTAINEPIYTAKKNVEVHIKGLFNWSISSLFVPKSSFNDGYTNFWAKLQHKDQGGTLINEYSFYNKTYHDENVTHVDSGQIDLSGLISVFTMNEGDTLQFIGNYKKYNEYNDPHPDPSKDGMQFTTDWKNEIDDFKIIETSYKINSFNADMVLPFEAISSLIQLMTSETNQQNLLRSNLLGRTDSHPINYSTDGLWSLLALTSGRGVSGKSISMSFRDLFISLNAVEPIGFWYDKTNDYFILEKIKEFYKQTPTAILGEVSELTIKSDKEHIFSKIKYGYENDNSYDEINGSIEFNTASNFSTPIDKTASTQNLRSTFRADTLGILLPKLKTEKGEGTNDTEVDNVNFFIDSQRIVNGYRVVNGSDITVARGIINAEQFYNVRITPKRNLCRNGGLIMAYSENYINNYFHFVSSKNDIDFETKINPTDYTIFEKDKVQGIEFKKPLTEPIIYEFEHGINLELRQQIKSDPHGYIEFLYKGEIFRGYIIEVELNGNQNKGSFKLVKKFETVV